MDIVIKLQQMNGMYIVGIIVDKDRIGIEIDETHLYYNYVIRKLVDSSMKIEDINSLKMYLKTHYNIEKAMRFKLDVSYWDSRKNYMVQIADIMCNTIWNVASSEKPNGMFRYLNRHNKLKICRLNRIR